MKKVSRENLIIRNSFQLAFAGSEIWCEELDALNVYADIVIEKFLKDMEIIKRPSSPSLIAVHLNETLVESELAGIVVTELKKAENAIYKVVFIGLDKATQKLIKSLLQAESVSFAYSFCNDYEKAKVWLVKSKR